MGYVKGDKKYGHVWWHCHKCHTAFVMGLAQAYRYRKAEKDGTLGGKRFYCSVECRREAVAEIMYERVHEPKRYGNWNASRIDAYWAKVADPNYYTGYRLLNAVPLSYRDRGVRIARPTGART
jgi:hypothetical protein